MFKIGEFSTIVRVSDVLLRHYDEVGLFKPAYVDPGNGYRYYTIEQLPALNRILVLRDLGLSLPQIGKLVADGITAEEIKGMLRLQEAEIEQTIAAEQSRLRRLQGRIKYLQNEGAMPDYEVVVKSVPEQPFLSLPQTLSSIREANRYYYELSEAVTRHRVNGLTHCLALFHDRAFRVEDVAWELGFLLREPVEARLRDGVPLADGRRMVVRPLPAVEEMATAVHIGPWAEMHRAFGSIGAWMEMNGYRIAGPARELYLKLAPPGEDDDFSVEVQIPVESK